MKSIIYYFSGTGNSFIVARDIANKMDMQMISISSLLDNTKIRMTADIIGIIFPDYHSNLPNLVRRFIQKMTVLGGKYIFGVCTYGGSNPGPTIKYLQRLIKIKEGTLSCGFAIKMPYNYIVPSFSLKKMGFLVTLKNIPDSGRQKMFRDWRIKCNVVCDFVKNQKQGIFEANAELLLNIIDFIKLKDSIGKCIWLRMAGYREKTDLSFKDSRKLMDHAFHVNRNCIGCGTCEKICPVANIILIDKKPHWHHNCEQCFACLQWCPKQAIQFGQDMENQERYHHPDVNTSDLIVKRF